MDEPVRRPRRRAALPPLLERVPQRPLDVQPGVRRPAPRRQGRPGQGLGLHGRDVDEVGRRRAREGRPLREPRTTGTPTTGPSSSCRCPAPVAPGETATLAIAWKAKVPKVYARAGYVRDFFFFGQWFPQIGVYEPKGRRRRADAGWNCHQYHANSEFYADWGDWRVAITLPEKFVVGSAGALVSETKAGGKKTLTFEQKAVHNFAFTADPRYVVVEDVFDPAKDIPKDELARAAKTLGRSEADLLAGSTRSRSGSTSSPITARSTGGTSRRRSGRSRGRASGRSRTPTRRSRSSTRPRTAWARRAWSTRRSTRRSRSSGWRAGRSTGSSSRRWSRSTSSRTATGWASSPRTSSRRAGWTRGSTPSPSS